MKCCWFFSLLSVLVYSSLLPLANLVYLLTVFLSRSFHRFCLHIHKLYMLTIFALHSERMRIYCLIFLILTWLGLACLSTEASKVQAIKRRETNHSKFLNLFFIFLFTVLSHHQKTVLPKAIHRNGIENG